MLQKNVNLSNHPNRSGTNVAANPSPKQIKVLRNSLNLSQTEAADILYCTLRGWQEWEAGNRRMHPAFWELFNIKSNK